MAHLALIFSDLHIHDYKQFASSEDRLANCIKVIKRLFKYADKNGMSHIFFSGDLFDKQRLLPTAVVTEVIRCFKELFEQYPDIHVYAISGNHDHAETNLLERPAISALTHLGDIFTQFTLIDDVHVELITNNNKRVYVFGIPYYEFPEHYHTKLDGVCNYINDSTGEDVTILLNHQTPAGIAGYGFGHDTDPTDNRYQYFNMVFCGHIHAHQQLTDNFLVVGSPIHRDRGDEGTEKGFCVFDLENPTDYVFKSLNKFFPEIRTIFEGEAADNDKDFFFRVPRVAGFLAANQMEGDVKTEQFNTSLSREELVRNFWEEVGEGDEELLAMGLRFIKQQ